VRCSAGKSADSSADKADNAYCEGNDLTDSSADGSAGSFTNSLTGGADMPTEQIHRQTEIQYTEKTQIYYSNLKTAGFH
jgi:hypothetical protein